MADLNPVEKELVDRLNNYDMRLKALENARQPYISDWNELSPVLFTFNTANIINVDTSISTSLYFQIGDKVKLIQAGVTKYFSILVVSANTITIGAGDSYTFTNNTITYFAFSKTSSPSGFPRTFDFVTNTITASGAMTVTGSASGSFIFNGRRLSMGVTSSALTLGGVASTDIYVQFPFASLLYSDVSFPKFYQQITNNSLVEAGLVSFLSTGIMVFQRANGSNWTLGAGVASVIGKLIIDV